MSSKPFHNTPITTLVGLTKNKTPSSFKGWGIEVEMELPQNRDLGVGLTSKIDNDWSIHGDGSLRNRGYEFVLRQPHKRISCRQKVLDLKKAFKDNGMTWYDTVRAGVHIHMDTSDMTVRNLLTFATVYTVLERSIVNLCGEGRSGNHFCLRVCDAEYVLDFLSTLADSGKVNLFFDRGDIRYAAMNYSALNRHGSVEFRALRTPQDLEKINTFINIFSNIRMQSLTFNNPRDVIEGISAGGEEQFVRFILGKQADKVIKQPNYVNDLMEGVRLIQDICYQEEWR